MKFEKVAAFSGVWIIEPVRHGDSRGYFSETFRLDEFRRHIGDVRFVQENESLSCRGALRGLHYQAGDAAQAKLVRVTEGAIVDVIVDLRRGQPGFGQWLAVEISADNGRQLFVPRGFAHGFAVLSDTARFQYKVDNFYTPAAERTLAWNDPALGITWPFGPDEAILSPKDRLGLPFPPPDCF